MPAVSRPPDRAPRPEGHHRARQERGHDAARHRCIDREPARTRAPLSGLSSDCHLPPGVSAAHVVRQSEGVGRPAARSAHDGIGGAGRTFGLTARLGGHETLASGPGRPYLLARGPTVATNGETFMVRKLAALLALAATLSLSGCGYNDLQRQDEGIKAAWSEVVNQYQRRADLVPNLVNTVKGYAAQEERVLTEVTNARANATSIKATPELVNDPAAFQKFVKAQSELTGALSRLMVVVENYPQLKSDALFRDLQSQLEGTENRIAVARNRYIKTVQEYNTTVRTFPTNLTAMVFKMDTKPNFTIENEAVISTPPKVDFGKTPGAQSAPAPAAKTSASADGKATPAPTPEPSTDLLKKGY